VERMNHFQSALAQRLGEFLALAGRTQLPSGMRAKVQEHLLDTFGVGIAGGRHPAGMIARRAAGRLGGAGPCSVWGLAAPKTSLFSATFANSVATHCLDFDDTHLGAIVHPSCVVIPAAVATAEAIDANMGSLLQAIGLGWELICRLGLVAGKDLDDRGFHVTGILGSFGAAAAVGHLLGLNVVQFRNALGLCCSQGAGTHQSMLDGAWNKSFHAGNAGQGGMASAFLAADGFLASPEGFEGAHGFISTMVPQTADNWKSFDTTIRRDSTCIDIAVKPYSCCHLMHACLDCVEVLTAERVISVDEIESVECVVPAEIVKLIGRLVDPTDSNVPVQAARFSLPQCMAMRLCGYEIGPEDFSEAVFRSAPITELAGRVRCVGKRFADYPERYPGEVTVTLRIGLKRRAVVKDCRGTGPNPLPIETLTKKFSRNVKGDAMSSAAHDFAHYILAVEETAPVRLVTERLGQLMSNR